MIFEKTRLFIAKPLHTLEGEDAAQPAAGAAPRKVVSDADEPTRFLAVERLLEQRGLRVSEAPPPAAALDDTDLKEALTRATWSGRARSTWRSLSLVSRLSLALLAVAALLPFTPRLFTGVHAASAPPSPVAPERAAAPAGTAAAIQAPATQAAGALGAAPVTSDSLALAGRSRVSPRAAADAAAQGRCREAVALYRELYRRNPAAPVYREAARILEEQHVGCSEGE